LHARAAKRGLGRNPETRIDNPQPFAYLANGVFNSGKVIRVRHAGEKSGPAKLQFQAVNNKRFFGVSGDDIRRRHQ
jgi:hypothetical protein